MKSIIIAAPQSGSGKTTITLGIMACLRRRGLQIAPFKVGPDFIDPGYHRLVAGRPSINLDGWMCGADFVRETFTSHGSGADMAVIEGVMGLFDGIGENGDEGSTAQIARLTGSPIVLVVDAGRMAGSAAALVKGFAEFDPQVNLAAVIFNNVAGDNHGLLLRKSMAAALPRVRVLGCIGRDERLHIPSRHLGLLTAEENPLLPAFSSIWWRPWNAAWMWIFFATFPAPIHMILGGQAMQWKIKAPEHGPHCRCQGRSLLLCL
ncbi:cobyrinate a,c-diamide synthase [Geotalea toluenoxydans]|uniref:cobyrinate a,c-diamide synthase n=1 Tax=Geotalea toluenoxydans TaxID=421624 RepID=UPI000ADD8B63